MDTIEGELFAEPVEAARPPGLADHVGSLVRTAFGAAALAADTLSRAAGAHGSGHDGGQSRLPVRPGTPGAGDAAFGVAWAAARAAGRVARVAGRAVSPVVGTALDPPLVPHALKPSTGLGVLAGRWRADRPALTGSAVQVGQSATPVAAETIARVIDLDAVLARVVDQLDLNGLVERILNRLDLTAVGESALRRADLDRLAGTALTQLDLTAVITEAIPRLDLDRVVAEVIDRVDVELAATRVLSRVDLEAVVSAALAEVDLTGIVVRNVDLSAVVNSALDQIDLTELVLARADLARIANTVIDEIDLPTTIRESTGSVASETVRGVRMQSVQADRAVARIVDRLTLRRQGRRLDAPGVPQSLADSQAAPGQAANSDLPDEGAPADRSGDGD